MSGGKKMHSIRVRITAITILAILSSILAIYFAGVATMRGRTDRNSIEMMNLIAEDTEKSLEKYFESIEQLVETTANFADEGLDSVFLVECGAVAAQAGQSGPTAEQTARLDAYLKDYCGRVRDFFSGVAGYTHGVVSYYYCLNPEISPNEHGFLYAKIGKTGFIEQPPVDARTLDPEDGLHSAWYDTAIRRGRPSWVGPYCLENSEDLWVYSYLVPVYNSGKIIGILGMDIPCDILIEQLRSIRVYDTGYACLFDGEGKVIYHPTLPIGSDPDELALTIRGSILRKASSGDELIRYSYAGEKRQLSFSTLSNGMKLVVTAPYREINASWSRLASAILLITVAVTVISAVLLFFVMHAITRPLQELTDASRRLAETDYDVELNYRGRDEVGALTDSFRKMRDQIKRYIEDLNHQLLTDKLTGLPNMRWFFRLAQTERDRMLKEGQKPAMLYLDIIGMQNLNRQAGFDAGDRMICRFARLLSGRFGERRVCRFSGDHFAAVAQEDGLEESLQAFFRECQDAGGDEPMLVRVGIYPNRLEDTDVNLACDRAKYACDRDRGARTSCFSWFDENMLRQDELYRYVIGSLDRALAEGWIQVYYQPIIRAADGKVCDEEALSRWIDPVKGFLSPADFIPALEEAKLIYKLDLYVVEQVLKKMKRQAEAGLFVVPQSVNLSRLDFDRCDIVEEIRRRVDEAGIARPLLSIEITESVVGSDFEFIKKQVERFRELGFQVWMDDFGSGYSSLDVLQHIHFDLIKFDMRFMERFDSGDECRIILTELMKMAIGLGVETICEGVEEESQVEFLREIGCTKIQGYYYGKPISFDTILSMYEKGVDMGFENPEEAEYYASIGRINLYDMDVLASQDDESLRRFFNTLPMSIIEVNGTKVKYNRCNKSYRDFLQRAFGMGFTMEEMDYAAMPEGPGTVFMSTVIRCSKDGNRAFADERIDDSTTVHTFVRRVAVNPVTGTAAVAVAVLAVIKDGENAGANYAHVAKALSADYVYLYYVNLETENFIEYSPDAVREDLVLERHGGDFFSVSRKEAREFLHKDDQEKFISAFTRENVEKAMDTQGAFTITYRLLMNGKPTYVDLKAVRMQGDRQHIIIGISNVDSQMRQKEALVRMQAEQATYSKINALTQDYLCIYSVDPATDRYVEYSVGGGRAGFQLPGEGTDWFARFRKESVPRVYHEDVAKFQTLFTRERIMEETEKNGSYAFQYRMMLDGAPTYVSLKAARVEEQNGPQLIIGICNVDTQVRREQDYEQKLSAARSKANLDTLTGVKNKTAYEFMSETLSRQIQGGQKVKYAIVLCRVSDIADVNESKGWEAGNQLIRTACAIVCNTFKHSPVFRVAGDEFAVIAEGHDFEFVDELTAELKERCRGGGVAASCGMAKYDETETVASVFVRAEGLCRGET